MFTDEIDLTLIAGHGGAGKVHFFAPPMRGPDGGNGGKGGDIYIQTTSDLTALGKFIKDKVLEAEKGEDGGNNNKFGKDGKDLTITVPQGCLLIDLDTEEEIELDTKELPLLIAKGGLGGRGNTEFKSAKNTTPRFAQPGLRGQQKRYKVILKLIADFGLIGLPNAGKSSLLNELTAANVKVANYPFTTLEPNLGMFNGKVLADIPGLIEGASSGKGLGIGFLKHIEKTSTLLHCISAESEDVTRDYKTIQGELKKYNPELLNKKEIILLTKSDLVSPAELKKKMTSLKKTKKEIMPLSIHDWDSLEKLKNLIVN